MMNREFNILYNEFHTSVERLRAGSITAKKTLQKGLVMDRFLQSFDKFLEVIKFIVKEHNVNCDFPANCIKEAVKFGLLSKETIYLEMLEDKYKIIQLKDKRCPEDLFLRVQVKYIPLLTNFSKKINNNYMD
ncbi:MAG: hypothetical protein P4L45_17410 [Ignavibacteriaceae bacterium]|nr:hypothetical protein [Ignavibacteriaceae bacterium]